MIPITNTRQRSVPDEIIDLLEDGQVLKNGNIIHQKGSIGTRDGQDIEVAGFPAPKGSSKKSYFLVARTICLVTL